MSEPRRQLTVQFKRKAVQLISGDAMTIATRFVVTPESPFRRKPLQRGLRRRVVGGSARPIAAHSGSW